MERLELEIQISVLRFAVDVLINDQGKIPTSEQMDIHSLCIYSPCILYRSTA